MSQVIAIANQKGGVGKTTTSVNLSSGLAEAGFKVLVIDLDPQANATTALGVDKHNVATQIYHVLMTDMAASEVRRPTEVDGLDVIPSGIDLTGAELELVSVLARETRLRHAIETVRKDYDFVFIDCPPSLGLLTVNALVAADSVIVPLQCEYYALEGLSSLLGTVDLVRRSLNARLRVHGVLLTMFDRRNRLSHQVEADVRGHFGDLVYATRIPRNVRLSESPSFGKPVHLYSRACSGAVAYRDLADELAQREAEFGGKVAGKGIPVAELHATREVA